MPGRISHGWPLWFVHFRWQLSGMRYCKFISPKAAVSVWQGDLAVWMADAEAVLKAEGAAVWEAAAGNTAAGGDDNCDENIPRMRHSQR